MKKIKTCCEVMKDLVDWKNIHGTDFIQLDYHNGSSVARYCPFCGVKIELEDEKPKRQIPTEPTIKMPSEQEPPKKIEKLNVTKPRWDTDKFLLEPRDTHEMFLIGDLAIKINEIIDRLNEMIE